MSGVNRNGRGLPALPDSWSWIKLRDVLSNLESGSRPKGGVRGITEGVPSVGGEHLTPDGAFDFTSVKYIPESFYEKMNRGKISTGDVLIVKDGATTGKTSLVGEGFPFARAAVNEHVFLLRPGSSISGPFLFFFLWSAAGQRQIAAQIRGAAQGGITQRFAGAVLVPLPRRAEQDRIVGAIEVAMTGVDDGVALLEEAQRLLDTHRGALLEAECLGRSPDRGHAPSEEGLPPIPRSWRWRSVAELAANEDRAITDGPFGSNLKTAHYTDSGPRVIRLQNIGHGEFIDAEAHISPQHFERLLAHEAQAGDVVVASLGETLPRACVVPNQLGPAIVKADCPRIRVGNEIRPEFLSSALNSSPVRRQAARLIAGIGRPRLNLGKLKQLRIPTPPLVEQDQILERIGTHAETRKRATEELAETYDDVEFLRRSILHRAFTGRLIRQDPAGASASEALDNLIVTS